MLVGIKREFGLGPLRRMIKHILRKICGEDNDLSPDMGTHSLPRVKPKHPADRPDINCCEADSKRLFPSLPNFARACGRVSVGRYPDKRPDSRQGMKKPRVA